MGAVDLGGGGKSRKKGTGAIKKPKRLGFKLDMTPLVDVAFLLLTFFMFATTMTQPQTMEMQVPPNDIKQVDVRASELWTIYVNDKGKLFYNTGIDTIPKPLEIGQVKDMSVEKNREAREGNMLITILKASPGAEYSAVVAVLDRLNQAEAVLTKEYAAQKRKRDRRFSIMPLEPAMRDHINSL